MSAPLDHYTPHGYLDNPYHTRNLNPSGVIRSSNGIGFAWHYPALPRGYGYREIYNASLNLALTVDGKSYYQHQDFSGLYADLHSKNVFRYRWSVEGLDLRAAFWRVGEHALACRVELSAAKEQEVRLTAFTRYVRHLGAAGVWGESGLVGRIDEGRVIIQGFEDGTAFALGGNLPFSQAGSSSTLNADFLAAPTLPDDHCVVTGKKGETVTLYGAAAYDLHLTAQSPHRLDLVLARDIRRDLALKAHDTAMTERATALTDLQREDDMFWNNAPRLEGDFPDHWRRGFVYDFETLRMMVKAPIGIYKHVWDAMQIQAPRVVLAEAAIDALLLGYADLGTARALLLGTFLDAPAPNVPCSREDGSYNMVGANGSECGTAPEWGYPIEVAAFLYDLDPDGAWLEAIYPGLKEFLEWWFVNRSDAEGYLVYDNSWESGQDLSARFGSQKEGGGSTIRNLRPVDLQAATTSACRTMKRFANILGRQEDETLWARREADFRTKVEALWHDDAYRDFDAHVGWSDVWDVMQLAPVALGLASQEKIETLRPQVQRLAHSSYLWPMFVWTATDAARAAGELGVAAQIAHDTIERAYRYWDSRDFQEDGRLPGVTCEYWGLDGRCGAEGYGWGAFGIHLLLRTLFGFVPRSDGSFTLTPNLPEDWLIVGKRYGIKNLRFHDTHFDLEYQVEGDGLRVVLKTAEDTMFNVNGQQGNPLQIHVANGATVKVIT
jgi:hypothetical protein